MGTRVAVGVTVGVSDTVGVGAVVGVSSGVAVPPSPPPAGVDSSGEAVGVAIGSTVRSAVGAAVGITANATFVASDNRGCQEYRGHDSPFPRQDRNPNLGHVVLMNPWKLGLTTVIETTPWPTINQISF